MPLLIRSKTRLHHHRLRIEHQGDRSSMTLDHLMNNRRMHIVHIANLRRLILDTYQLHLLFVFGDIKLSVLFIALWIVRIFMQINRSIIIHILAIVRFIIFCFAITITITILYSISIHLAILFLLDNLPYFLRNTAIQTRRQKVIAMRMQLLLNLLNLLLLKQMQPQLPTLLACQQHDLLKQIMMVRPRTNRFALRLIRQQQVQNHNDILGQVADDLAHLLRLRRVCFHIRHLVVDPVFDRLDRRRRIALSTLVLLEYDSEAFLGLFVAAVGNVDDELLHVRQPIVPAVFLFDMLVLVFVVGFSVVMLPQCLRLSLDLVSLALDLRFELF
mmetsp:Transcript_5500/g.9216  ORF Transcript_5500/g.9216 Transcript_5500/m.9216 type:complete len:330 (+) Transcript_5500:194-1183(+)